jgi:hypothetical protein
MVRDGVPEVTTVEYQSVCPWVIVPTVIGEAVPGRFRPPAGVIENPALLSTSCAETPDMSTRAQTRIAILIPDTFIVTGERFRGPALNLSSAIVYRLRIR